MCHGNGRVFYRFCHHSGDTPLGRASRRERRDRRVRHSPAGHLTAPAKRRGPALLGDVMPRRVPRARPGPSRSRGSRVPGRHGRGRQLSRLKRVIRGALAEPPLDRLQHPHRDPAHPTEESASSGREVTAEGIVQRWLAENAKVYLNSGSSYGTGGAGHMRMNLATSRRLWNGPSRTWRAPLRGRRTLPIWLLEWKVRPVAWTRAIVKGHEWLSASRQAAHAGVH